MSEDDDLVKLATSPTTFAACKAADVATTAYIVKTGIGVEANPIVAPLIAHGFLPLILVSLAMYYALKEYAPPAGIMGANTVTCGAAFHNLLLIL